VVMDSFEVCCGFAGGGLKKAREMVRTVGLRAEILTQIQINSANQTRSAIFIKQSQRAFGGGE